jgi:hypothetical protein
MYQLICVSFVVCDFIIELKKKFQNLFDFFVKYLAIKISILVRYRSNCLVVFIDENHLAPILVSESSDSITGKNLEIYHPDPEMNFLKFPPMSVEVWLDLEHGNKLNVEHNFEPFKKRFLQNEVGWGLRSFLRDAKTFRVEFIKQIHKDMPWCWLGNVKANNENLKEKVIKNIIFFS